MKLCRDLSDKDMIMSLSTVWNIDMGHTFAHIRFSNGFHVHSIFGMCPGQGWHGNEVCPHGAMVFTGWLF